ncbi:hypothetical protein B0H14DRAFT_2580007 [Mycena olivaceomarginata]|nr:hypothetical protein B0H14DRAFT_2580007 [Mycena olivaceomarginata]
MVQYSVRLCDDSYHLSILAFPVRTKDICDMMSCATKFQMYNGCEGFLAVFCAMRPGKNIKPQNNSNVVLDKALDEVPEVLFEGKALSWQTLFLGLPTVIILEGSCTESDESSEQV